MSLIAKGELTVANLNDGKTAYEIAVDEGFKGTEKEWLKSLEGTDGISVSSVDVEYAQSTSNATPPKTGWGTDAPQWKNGNYIWSRTKTTYSRGNPTYSYPVCITGQKGSSGSDGRGISDITEQYYLSTSKTDTVGGSWVEKPPVWVADKYMWTRSKINYTNPTGVEYTPAYVDTAWEAIIDLDDRIITIDTNSKEALKNNLGQLGVEKKRIDSQYKEVYDNINLIGVSKTNLSSAKTTFNTRQGALVTAISILVELPAGVSPTDVQKKAVDTAFSAYANSLDVYERRLQQALDAISGKKVQDVNDELGTVERRVTTAEQKITDSAITSTVTSSTTFKTVAGNASSAKSTLDRKSKTWDDKASTGYVDTKVDSIEVGGRNLLRNSNRITTNANNTGLGKTTLMKDEKTEYHRIVGNGSISTYGPDGKYNSPVFTEDMSIGDTYTMSVEVRVKESGNLGFYSGNPTKDINTLNTWVKISQTYEYTNEKRVIGFTFNKDTLDYRNWKLEKGNKVTDWTPAPEDVEEQISNAYENALIDSEVKAKEVAKLEAKIAKEYSDTELSKAERARLEADKANLALLRQEQQSAENRAKVYADGKVSKEEKARLEADKANLAEAKAVANLAEVNAKAHADGKITAEEKRAIADAERKLSEAKAYAKTQMDSIEIGGRNYLLNSKDFSFSRPSQVVEHLGRKARKVLSPTGSMYINPIEVYSDELDKGEPHVLSVLFSYKGAKRGTPTMYTGAYVPVHGELVENQWNRIYIVQKPTARIHTNFSAFDEVYFTDWKLEKGTKPTDWAPAPEDIEAHAEAIAKAEAELAEIEAKAHADGRVDAEEKRAIADAKQKLADAKSYAKAQDAVVKSLADKAQADANKANQAITKAESDRATAEKALKDAQTALDNALREDSADKQAKIDKANQDLAKAQRDLATANSNIAEARRRADKAQKDIDELEIGGRNLYISSDTVGGYESAGGITVSAINHQTMETITPIVGSKKLIYQHWNPNSHNPANTNRIAWFNDSGAYMSSYTIPKLGGVKYLAKEISIPSGATGVRLGAIVGQTGVIDNDIKIKFEFGSKPTDWTPAPEDIDEQITTITERISTAEHKITDDAIRSTVTSHTVFKEVQTNANSAKSTLDSKGKTWDSKASTGYVDGKAGTAETNAKNHANSKASTAESNAKKHADDKVDSIEVGGRNLIVDNNLVDGWANSAGGITKDASYKTTEYIELEEGKDYTYQLWNPNALNTWWTAVYYNASDKYVGGYISRYISDKYAKETINTNKYAGARKVRITYSHHDSKLQKLEKGNMATDWTPAPEDIDEQIISVTERMAKAEQKITDDAIRSTVTSHTTFKDVQNKANSAKSTLDSKTKSWDAKASTGYVNEKSGNAESNAKKHADSKTEEVKDYVASRGENLVTNGTGLLKDNTNFSQFVFDGSDAFGTNGSFTYNGGSSSKSIDELIPVDVEATYRMSYAIKANPHAGSRAYGMVRCYDVDGKEIMANNTMYREGSLTTLVKPINNGDTVIHLKNASGWFNGGTSGVNTHLRTIILWNYKNSFGYQYPAETYSRNRYSNSWEPNAINLTNNTIKLRTPWSHGFVEAGTELSNGSDGGNYKYVSGANFVIPEEWELISGTIGGIDHTGKNNVKNFHPATASIKLGWLLNRYEACKTWITNVSFNVDHAGAIKDVSDKTDVLKNTTIPQLSSRVSTAEQKITDSAIRNTVTSHTTFKDVQNKANSAKSTLDNKAGTWDSKASTGYVDGKANTAEGNAKKHADTQASSAESRAKSHADAIAVAKANLAEVNAKAHADGKITAEEKRAIADAQKKLDDAKRHADSKASTAETNAKGYADKELNKIPSWSKNYNVSTAKPLALTKKDGSPLNDLYSYEISGKVLSTGTNTYAYAILKSKSTSGQGGAGWDLEKIEEFGTSSNHPEFFIDSNGVPSVRMYGHASAYSVNVTHSEFSGRETTYSRARADADAIAVAKANLAEVKAKAHADGIVSAEEKRAIQDAKNRLAEAKKHADSKASIAETNAKKHADAQVGSLTSRVSSAEQKITDSAIVSTVTQSNTYKNAMTGKVSTNNVISSINQTAEKISIHANKLDLNGVITMNNLAKGLRDDFDSKATKKDLDSIEIGGRNLLSNSGEEKSTNRYMEIPVRDIFEEHIGRKVTISLDFKINTGGTVRNISFYPYQNNGITIKDSFSITPSKIDTWTRYEFATEIVQAGTVPSYSGGAIALYDGAGNNSYSVRKIKIELGNKATDWTPAPEDINEQLAEKASAEDLGGVLDGLAEVDGRFDNYVSAEDLVDFDTEKVAKIKTATDTLQETAKGLSDIVNLKDEDAVLVKNLNQAMEVTNFVDTRIVKSKHGIFIGENASGERKDTGVLIQKNMIVFLNEGNIVAYIEGGKMMIGSGVFMDSIHVGGHRQSTLENADKTVFEWVGREKIDVSIDSIEW